MNLPSSTTWARGSDHRSTAQLLDELSAGIGVRRRGEVQELRTLIAWADANVVDDDAAEVATVRDSYVDTGVPIAGPGAPLVSEFALGEVCATLERSLDSGREYVGKVIEVGWRLPTIREAVYAGKVPVWKALRVAELTRSLSLEAAAYVDRNLGFALPGCTWAQVERLVTAAIDRFDPDTALERLNEAADGRHCTIDLAYPRDGVVDQWASLDTADAIDLDTAIARRAEELRLAGSTDSLDVRRSVALGEIARGDLALDLPVADPTTGEITRVLKGRKVELLVHLSEAAVTGVTAAQPCQPDVLNNVGRLGNTQTPINVEQVKQWISQPGTQVNLRPVIDLAGHQPVDSYEIPDRLRLVVEERDHTCRAPHCHRKVSACDLDHARPHGKGGATCPCNLVPLCRRHHRAKTFEYWIYEVLAPGLYLWTSKNRRQFLVGPFGTRTLTTSAGQHHPDQDEPPWAHPGWPDPNDAEPPTPEPEPEPPPTADPPLWP